MSRLTTKIKDGFYVADHAHNTDEVTYKLGKLEDLEEEIGCQLEVFVKALKNGIYYDDKFEHPIFILDKDNFKTKDYHLLVTGTIVYLKDYKKTWWLKEDKSE